MKIVLSSIEKEPRRFEADVEVSAERLAVPEVVDQVAVHLEGALVRHQDGFALTGRFAASGAVLCARCLTPVSWSEKDSFVLDIRAPLAAPTDEEVDLAAEDLDVVFVEGDELDLVEVAAEQVLLALPMKVLCDDSCAGLCPSCGGNRNVAGQCRCEPEVDPRWEALRTLKDHVS